MNAKEKAKEMYDKMLNSDIMNMTKYCAKQCAMVAVDEIISIGWNLPHYDNNTGVKYWAAVKSELQFL